MTGETSEVFLWLSGRGWVFLPTSWCDRGKSAAREEPRPRLQKFLWSRQGKLLKSFSAAIEYAIALQSYSLSVVDPIGFAINKYPFLEIRYR